MAYRKTEKGLARAEAQRQLLIASALDLVTKSGLEALTLMAVAKRGGVAAGLLYNYFADITELHAAVIAHLLARDLGAMREASGEARDERNALIAAITALVERYPNGGRLAHGMMGKPTYSKAIREELERLIKPLVDSPPRHVRLAAHAVLGIVVALTDATGTVDERAHTAVLFSLRGIGVRVPA